MSDDAFGLLKEARASMLRLNAEKEELAEAVKAAEEEKIAAQVERDVYKTVIDLIASGRIDPDDAMMKAASYVANPTQLELAKEMAKTAGSQAGSIGRPVEPDSETDPDANPVVSYLLGQQ
jgi:hypothetical protein